jgi:hypothetical protein
MSPSDAIVTAVVLLVTLGPLAARRPAWRRAWRRWRRNPCPDEARALLRQRP